MAEGVHYARLSCSKVAEWCYRFWFIDKNLCTLHTHWKIHM